MSKEIGKLNLSHLLVATHYEFHRSTSAAILATTATVLKLDTLYPQYQTELDTLFKLVNRAQGNVLSLKIEEADRARDVLLLEIFGIIDNAAKSPLAARNDAGQLLKRIAAPYRGIAQNEYAKETGQIRGFLRDLGVKEENIDAQETLGIEVLVQELRKANNKLSDYMIDRSTETGTAAATMKLSTDEQRKVVDAIYHDIVDRVNAVANLQPTEEVLNYISRQNGLIERTKSILTHMRAGGTGTEKGTGGKEEETPETPEIPGNE
ncbi:DUF6261 family protein [Bacteroides sp. OttesenSCG-928-J23]|nr:DUF6261 family protein [Bacteroides sp. OttesenSCG-928-J23]MDL2299511.1 DUF6261 family protein [Bacteroides sp. OttesenSCG-928-E20]